MKYLGINPLNLTGSLHERTDGVSKFVKLNIDGVSYTPIISSVVNHWGINNEESNKTLSEIKEEKDYLLFHSHSGEVNTPRYLVGYPSIRLGRSPWDKSGGFEFGQVKDYKKINLKTKWDFDCVGQANFVYDIWLTKNRDGKLTSDDLEVMVWLDYTKGVDYWENIGNFDGANVRYKRKTPEWNNGGHVIAFVYPDNKKKSDLDLSKIINYCNNQIKGIDNYWIRSVELGTEFAKNTDVKIKLYKSKLNLTKN
jgi:hypothetical protein